MGNHLILDFFGLPGSGKSTITHLVAEKLRADGYSVSEPSYEMDHGNNGVIRSLKKLAYTSFLFLRPSYLLLIIRVIKEVGVDIFSKEFLQHIVNLSYKIIKIRHSKEDVLIFDEGICQSILSLYWNRDYSKCLLSLKSLETVVKGRRLIPIYIETDLHNVINRIAQRREKQGRAEFLEEKELTAILKSQLNICAKLPAAIKLENNASISEIANRVNAMKDIIKNIMGEYVTNIDVNEAIWRNHYQIVTADEDDVDCRNPRFFGSAFSLIYRNRRWIVTADHVIHPEKHNIAEVPEGVDVSKIEHRYFLINNVNAKQKLETILTSLFGFYFYDKFNKEMLDFTKEELEELGATADDFFTRIDVAFADISKGLPCQPLTHALLDNNNISVVVAHGLEKLSLLEESIAEPSKDKIYYDFGVVKNDIVGIKFVRCNAAYGGIKFVEERDGLYIFECPTDIKYDEWAALSGSAMFDGDGKVVGMTIRVNPDNRNIIVVPMKIILRLMDYAIAHEENENK